MSDWDVVAEKKGLDNPWAVASQKPVGPDPGATVSSATQRTPSSRFPGGIESKRVGQTQAALEATSALPAAGAIIGSAAGPAGTIAGGAAGKSWQNAFNQIFGLEPKKSPGALIVEPMVEGVKQGAMDIAARAALSPFEIIGNKYVARYSRPAQVEARAAAERAGQPLTGMEAVGPKITRQEVVQKNLTDALAKTTAQLGQKSTMQEAGKVAGDAMEVAEKNFEDVFGRDYTALNAQAKKAGKNVLVDTSVAQKEFNTFLKTSSKVRAAAPKSAAYQGVADAIMQDMGSLPNLDFATAQALRSKWLKIGREAGNTDAVIVSKKAAEALDTAMENTAKGIGGSFYSDWRSLNEGYKQGRELFNSTYITGLAKRDPEALVASIKGGNVTKAEQVRDSLLKYGGAQGQGAWQTVQRAYADHLFADGDIFKLGQELKNAGPEVLNTIYGTSLKSASTLQGMKDVATAADAVARTETGKGINLTVRHIGSGVLHSVFRLTGALADRAASTLMVKTIENPVSRKIFIDGLLKSPAKFASGVADMERAMSIAVKGMRVRDMSKGKDSEGMAGLDQVLSLGNAP